MPLPLILIPVIAGVVVSGTAAASTAIYLYLKRRAEAKEHKALLEAQNRITKQRIADAHRAVESLQAEVREVGAEVKAATSIATDVANALHASSEKILLTSSHAKMAAQFAATSTATLAASLPTLTKLADGVHADAEITTAAIEALTARLEKKEGELVKTEGEIRELRATIERQGVAIMELHGTVKTLTTENETQKRTIHTLGQRISNITAEAQRTLENFRFFKQQVAREATPTPGRGVPIAVAGSAPVMAS